MLESYRYSTKDWIVVIGVWILGLLISSLGVFGHLYGVTPADKLTRLEDIATNCELTHSGGKRGGGESFVEFRVDMHRVHYSSDLPRFEAVLNAVESGKKLQVWVSTERETVFARDGWVPLYQLAVDDLEILSYQEVADAKRGESRIILPFGLTLFLAGLWGLYCGVHNKQPNLFYTPDKRSRLKRLTVLFSALVYGALIGVVLFADSVHAKLIEAFGARPFGMPVRVVVIAGMTLLCLPVPFFAWHLFQLVVHRFEQGKRFGFGFLLFGRSTDEVHGYSLRVCRVALTYYAVLCAAWITFMVWRGI